jgi:hypothetical protein
MHTRADFQLNSSHISIYRSEAAVPVVFTQSGSPESPIPAFFVVFSRDYRNTVAKGLSGYLPHTRLFTELSPDPIPDAAFHEACEYACG